MDKECLRKELSRWFKKEFIIEQIFESIELRDKYKKKGKAKNRKDLLAKASTETDQLIKTLINLERDHLESYNELEEDIRLKRLLDNGFNNGSSESISEMLILINMALKFRISNHTKSTTANMIKKSKDGHNEFYFTNSHSRNFRMIFELERIWETSTSIPIEAENDSEFISFLALCLYGDKKQGRNANIEFSRFRTKAESWGQKR
jgi:hypothetical protein